MQSRGEADGGYWYEAYSFRSAEHGGTHIDAPVHFAKGGRSVEAIPLDDLVGPACVIDVATAAVADADYQVTVADIKAWENQHGALPAGAIVLLRTGYGAFWPDAARYLGTAERGQEAVPELRFPGLHPDAARWLVGQRRLDAIDIDTPSIDFRPIAIVRIASHPVRAQRARLRERGESGSPAGDRRLGHRAAHEDPRRQRRPFANSRVATGLTPGAGRRLLIAAQFLGALRTKRQRNLVSRRYAEFAKQGCAGPQPCCRATYCCESLLRDVPHPRKAAGTGPDRLTTAL